MQVKLPNRAILFLTCNFLLHILSLLWGEFFNSREKGGGNEDKKGKNLFHNHDRNALFKLGRSSRRFSGP